MSTILHDTDDNAALSSLSLGCPLFILYANLIVNYKCLQITQDSYKEYSVIILFTVTNQNKSLFISN